MKKILFIEAVRYGNYFDDRYEHIRTLGFDVFVLYGEGQVADSEAPRRRSAGARDAECLIEAAQNWHSEERFDGITTLAETSVLVVSEAARALDLSYASPRQAVASRNKFAMREAHAVGGAPHPDFLGISDLADLDRWPQRRFPAIVKPSMGSASYFVFRADDPAELHACARTVLQNTGSMMISKLEAAGLGLNGPPALVEEFLCGSEHLVEGYVFDGRFVLGAVVDRVTVEGKSFDDDVHRAPSRLRPNDVQLVVDALQAAVSAQGIDRAPVHGEIRFHNGLPHIVEVAIRPGGGGLNLMAQISYGYDPLEALAKIAVGVDPGHKFTGPKETHTAAACVIRDAGKVQSISGTDEINRDNNIFFFKLLAKPGSILDRPPRGNSVVGFLGAKGENAEAAFTHLQAADQQLTVQLQENANVEA